MAGEAREKRHEKQNGLVADLCDDDAFVSGGDARVGRLGRSGNSVQ